MGRFFKDRHSPALVISIVALVMALSGTGYAASTIATHGNASAAKKKKKKSTRGPRGPRGPRGFAGLQGAGGPAGPAGQAGAPGATGATGPSGTPSTIGQSGLKTATKSAAGTNVTLLKAGTFTIQGNCLDEGAGKVTAVLQLVNNGAATASVQWDSAIDGVDVPAAGTLNVSRPASAIPPANKLVGPGDGDTSFAALSPDGSRIVAEGMAGVGAIVPAGSDCAFSVTSLG